MSFMLFMVQFHTGLFDRGGHGLRSTVYGVGEEGGGIGDPGFTVYGVMERRSVLKFGSYHGFSQNFTEMKERFSSFALRGAIWYWCFSTMKNMKTMKGRKIQGIQFLNS